MDAIPKLPLELIFHVIASLLGNPRAILPPSHPTTKTLLSLTLVCRATYPVASNYLRQHCAYIDDDRRLGELIYCVESTRSSPLRPVTALYLAPFGASLDQPTDIRVRELLILLGPHLARLVVDLPLRGLRPADDYLGLRRTLRTGFRALERIEELVSIRDELYLDVLEPDWRRRDAGAPDEGGGGDDDNDDDDDDNEDEVVWTAWPRLRRLALYNVDAHEIFWAGVRASPRLETVVLTRADGLRDVCMKRAYLGTAEPEPSSTAVGASGATPPRPLKVVMVNVWSDHPDDLRGQEGWDKVDPGHVVDVMRYNVPTSFYGDEDAITLCQEWVKTAALRGDLWDWEGTRLGARTRGGGDASGAQAFELEAHI